MEENNIISDEKEIANIMNNYFINVTKTLNLKKQLGVGCSGVNEFENHISIKMIHEKYPEEVKLSEVISVYKKLDPLQKENYRPASLLPHVS